MAGTGSGKLGSQVYASVAGEQIVRQYQSNVSNPSTTKQVNQRARMKLMSQVAAAMSEVIVIPKQGLKSSRNLFIKANFGYSYANAGEADATLVNFQLTNGNIAIPDVTAERQANDILHLELAAAADNAVSRVVYCIFGKSTEQALMYLNSIVVTYPGENRTFPADTPNFSGDLIIYAYGMRDTSAKASAKYSDYAVATGEDLAKLLMNRTIAASDYQLTKTVGVQLGAEESTTPVVPAGSASVVVHLSGLGSVQGAGVYTLGSQVTLTAVPYAGWSFKGWRINGSSVYVSSSNPYTFTLNVHKDLVADFISDLDSEN